MPGYPTNEHLSLSDSGFEGQKVRETSFQHNDGFKIGNFNAFDFFGYGSFHLLDSLGNVIRQLCALARVTTSPDSFIFMGADACHHGGEFRPSMYLPYHHAFLPAH